MSVSPGRVRAYLVFFAVQSIVSLLETSVANMAELALLVVALSLIETKAYLRPIRRHSRSFAFGFSFGGS